MNFIDIVNLFLLCIKDIGEGDYILKELIKNYFQTHWVKWLTTGKKLTLIHIWCPIANAHIWFLKAILKICLNSSNRTPKKNATVAVSYCCYQGRYH